MDGVADGLELGEPDALGDGESGVEAGCGEPLP
jgi:hypothetical protein